MSAVARWARSSTGALRRLPGLRVLTRLGWTVGVLGLAAWVAAWQLGWDELAVIAAVCLIAVVASLPFTAGRPSYDVVLEVRPQRVAVGGRVNGHLVARNPAGRRLLPGRVELTVGAAGASFSIPSLAEGEAHEALFSIPTNRRAVIPVGPASSVRGDPIGLARSERTLTDVEELFVHPRTVPLDRFGSGLLKDLEGQTTNDLSTSDVAFHTLREYVPGDDRRHVHWKASAKRGSLTGSGGLLVRQYVDTRRSHLALVVSTSSQDYRDDDEFELALSLAASLGVRAIRDEQTVSVIAGGRSLPSTSDQRMLDAFARIEGDDAGTLQAAVLQANASASTASVVALTVGSTVSLADVRSAANRLVGQARVFVIRADTAGALAYRRVGTTVLISVPTLDDFAQGLWRATHL